MRLQGRRQVEKIYDLQFDLLDLIMRLRDAGEPTDSLTRGVQSILTQEMDLYERSIRWFSSAIDDLRDDRASTPPDQLGELAMVASEVSGRPVSEQEIALAARAAHAHEFIAQLPEGYQTVIGDQGLRLSGGQRG